jgi:hypothetical protein
MAVIRDPAFEAARARVAADLMEHLLGSIDFARLEDGHASEVLRMSREALGRYRGSSIGAALGGDDGLERVANALAEEALAYRPFYALLQDDDGADVLVNGHDQL